MNKIVIASLVIFIFSGCSQLKANRIAEQKQQRETELLSLQSLCQTYGFAKGTESFSNCMMKLDQRLAEETSKAADRAAYIKANKKPFELKTLNTNTPYALGGGTLTGSRSTHCESRQVGFEVHTDCR